MSHKRFSQPLWHLIDAKNQIVGRLATQVVTILRGKHKPTFSPNYDCGDYVVIINARYVKFTGDKVEDKTYKWHTGYPGGLKQKSVKNLIDSKPEEVLRRAVLGMLPKNTLRYHISKKLRIFPEETHLHYDKLPRDVPSILS